MHPLKKIGFLWSYSLIAVIGIGYYVGVTTWAGVGYVFVVIPLLDWLAGRDRQNVAHDAYDNVLNDRYFDALLYSFVYLHYGLLAWGGYVLLTASLTLAQQVGLVVSIGIFGGTVINVAHELGHRSSRVAQVHAKLALASVSYLHWGLEHNRGHHVHVATPHDPATARYGQSLYAFWWQSVVGGYRSAWRIEQKLLAKAGQPVWSRHNDMLWFAGWPALLTTLLTGAFSLVVGYVAWLIPVFFVAQSVVAVLLLESVNYIEHYGMLRREVAPGRYERVNPLHSWNASHYVSNLVLFQLQRHADHHAYAARPYQVLRHFDESPQLPAGYPLMMLLALVPPLWFAVMNPRLRAWRQQAHDATHIAAVVKQFA